MRSITPPERDTFRADGVVCLRAALDSSTVAAMAEPLERALESRAMADLSAMGRSLAASGENVVRDGSGRGRFSSGVDHWKEFAEFFHFAGQSALPRLVAELLESSSLWLYEDSVLVKEPGTAERTAWHQDLGYFHVDGEQLATTWCPLDVVTAATGAVRYVRGSHQWDSRYRPNLFVSTMAIPGTVGDEVPDVDAMAAAGTCEIVSFDTAPGDVVVHHARTLHGAGPNRSAVTRRRAISVRYCGNDTRTRLRPGAPRKPHQEAWTDGLPFATLDPGDHPQVWGPETAGTAAD